MTVQLADALRSGGQRHIREHLVVRTKVDCAKGIWGCKRDNNVWTTEDNGRSPTAFTF